MCTSYVVYKMPPMRRFQRGVGWGGGVDIPILLLLSCNLYVMATTTTTTCVMHNGTHITCLYQYQQKRESYLGPTPPKKRKKEKKNVGDHAFFGRGTTPYAPILHRRGELGAKAKQGCWNLSLFFHTPTLHC
jgi:hypothetical protein